MAIRRKARSQEAPAHEQILPEAEMEILAVLHGRGEADAREIREALTAYRPMSHASVLTLLGRLEVKELVTRRKGPVGKAFVYTAAKSPKPMYRTLIRRLVRRIFANDPSRLVASLFEAKPPTRDELRKIRALVEELEKRS
ncbi:MAG: BlaI/MecI/CopY family transcriptional regulator [Acidobacteriota bacterium]